MVLNGLNFLRVFVVAARAVRRGIIFNVFKEEGVVKGIHVLFSSEHRSVHSLSKDPKSDLNRNIICLDSMFQC